MTGTAYPDRWIGQRTATQRELPGRRATSSDRYGTRRRNCLRILFMASALLAGCGLQPPAPVESEYFTSTAGGFAATRSERTIRYSLLLSARVPIPAGAVIVAHFENPAGGSPLGTRHEVQADEREFLLESPPVTGLRAGRDYTIEVTLYTDASLSSRMGTHVQRLQNLINQDELGW